MIFNSKRKIYVDSREQALDRARVIEQITELGYPTKVIQQDFGDYRMFGNDYFVVDRKKTLNELASNVGKDHSRLVEEIKRAEQQGACIMFLIEDSSKYKCLEDVKDWVNTHANGNPKAMTGEKLYKTLETMREEYPIDFEFCTKSQTGKRIVELLEGALISGRGRG